MPIKAEPGTEVMADDGQPRDGFYLHWNGTNASSTGNISQGCIILYGNVDHTKSVRQSISDWGGADLIVTHEEAGWDSRGDLVSSYADVG